MIHCIPTSNGEILDKLSILLIKQNKTIDTVQLSNINNEINYIQNIVDTILMNKTEEIKLLYTDLQTVNQNLWNIEDRIREKEKLKQFDQEFIDLARSVYIKNDQRAKIKKDINVLSNSHIIEEKIYDRY